MLYSREGDNISKLQFRFQVMAIRYDHFMKAKILEQNKLPVLGVTLTVPRKPRSPRQSLSSNSVHNSFPQYAHKSQCTYLQLFPKRSSPKTNNSYPNILWHFTYESYMEHGLSPVKLYLPVTKMTYSPEKLHWVSASLIIVTTNGI